MAHIGERTLAQIGFRHDQDGILIGQIFSDDNGTFCKPGKLGGVFTIVSAENDICLLYTSPSPRD